MSSFQRFDSKKKLVVALVLAVAIGSSAGGQTPGAATAPALPDAPQPVDAADTGKNVSAGPCETKNAAATLAATAAVQAAAVSSSDKPLTNENPRIVGIVLCVPHLPVINWYARFLNGPQVKALTPMQKAHLAARNLVDPFNLLTIGGEAAISVAANSHSPYGPGIHGYMRYVGVSFTQNMTGEFFGTFLIPSIVHQDPHYHRMPTASIKRRALHTVTQIVWTQGDNGNGMLNYADLVGFAIDDEIGNLYVPGQETNSRASAERYGIALATAPIDNVITEFLPDVASHIHVQIVVIQRIINQVATKGTNSQ